MLVYLPKKAITPEVFGLCLWLNHLCHRLFRSKGKKSSPSAGYFFRIIQALQGYSTVSKGGILVSDPMYPLFWLILPKVLAVITLLSIGQSILWGSIFGVLPSRIGLIL